MMRAQLVRSQPTVTMKLGTKLVSREPALTPALSPGERETSLPRLGKVVALGLVARAGKNAAVVVTYC